MWWQHFNCPCDRFCWFGAAPWPVSCRVGYRVVVGPFQAAGVWEEGRGTGVLGAVSNVERFIQPVGFSDTLIVVSILDMIAIWGHICSPKGVKQRKLNKLRPIFKPTPYIVTYPKTALAKIKLKTVIAKLQETYRTFVEFRKMLFFGLVYLMNQTMTLNWLGKATMIILITISGTIFYVADNSLVDMVSILDHYAFCLAIPGGIYLLKANNRSSGVVLVSLLLTLKIFHTLL